MKQYKDLMRKVLDEGEERIDRTGVGTKSIFGQTMRFKMSDGFPAVTTKKLAFNAMKAELLWFLKGSSDNTLLNEMGCHIWNANAESDYWKPKARYLGDLGRIYGVQWRSWRATDGREIDQLKNVIEQIKKDPSDRRLIVSAWNPGELDQMALPPCHMFMQFYVNNGKLSLSMYQRSGDVFLGVPFNIASYSLLLHMVAQATGLEADEFFHIIGDTHIYLNHIEQVEEQLSKEPFSLSRLWLNPDVKDIDKFGMEDIRLENYQSHPSIKAPMAV
jgi:thymidylate synthase